MIVNSFGRYLPKTVHDHEFGLAGPRRAGAEVQEAQDVEEWPRLPVLVPFWNPPNSTERTMRITISSTIHSRQPRARDRGRRRRSRP